MLEGFAQILKSGIVITSDPLYYIYGDYLERIGYQLLAIPEDKYGINIESLEDKLGKSNIDLRKIRFIYTTTVSNPTCTILANSRTEALVQTAIRLSYRMGRRIPILFDRAYDLLVHDPAVETLKSGFHYDDIGIVYEIGSLSKIFAPGLRIGYLIGKESKLISAMIQRASDVGFGASLINQEIASYLLDHYGTRQLKLVKDAYRRKAEFIKDVISKYLGPYLVSCQGGQGGFYYYLTFKKIETHPSSLFFKYLSRSTGNTNVDGMPINKKPKVAYIPGTYCVHQTGELVETGRRQLRLSYAFETEDNLERAIKLMKEAIEYQTR